MSTARAAGEPEVAASGARRRGGESGFTLIELAVATAVLLLAVLLACELFAESGRLLHHSVRRARDPWMLIAGELLRNDLRGAAPPAPLEIGLPQHGPLRLDTAIGEPVVWMLSGDRELVRSVGGVERVYLQEVRRFYWRQVSRDAVEVWVRYHVSSPYLRQLAGSLPKSDAGADEELHLLVVVRGGGETDQW